MFMLRQPSQQTVTKGSPSTSGVGVFQVIPRGGAEQLTSPCGQMPAVSTGPFPQRSELTGKRPETVCPYLATDQETHRYDNFLDLPHPRRSRA
ncbi:hypothetical protein Poly24_31200 [Rosistilla carotiformis]|uniref:Uncharacterized protein n=1 Tax=Rosistilla carotiformis TaxID=2528017 RepID=A0A518JV30_9BACT|nr:hypothetical protein Poly24_31200 [Rosistilla carotiformis]